MNKEDVYSALNECALYSALCKEHLSELAGRSSTSAHSSGEDISSLARNALIVIGSGSANVYSEDSESNTLLRVLSKGDVFGISGLIGGYKEISRVCVKSTSLCAISVPRECIIDLISKDACFASGYISLLEKKIVFLNRRIAAFTAGTCERRLASFLNSVSGEEQFEIGPIALSSLAKQLNMGRASLYRALDSFEAEGIIERKAKAIKVMSRTLLKTKYLK